MGFSQMGVGMRMMGMHQLYQCMRHTCSRTRRASQFTHFVHKSTEINSAIQCHRGPMYSHVYAMNAHRGPMYIHMHIYAMNAHRGPIYSHVYAMNAHRGPMYSHVYAMNAHTIRGPIPMYPIPHYAHINCAKLSQHSCKHVYKIATT